MEIKESRMTVEFFEVVGNRVGPLTVGHYWIAKESQLLLRGPFSTEKAAVADFKRIGIQLLKVINKKTMYTLAADLGND